MNIKLTIFIVFLLTIQLCQSGRFPRDESATPTVETATEIESSSEELKTNQVKTVSDSDEEFTEKDVQKLTEELSKALPAADVEKLRNIFKKFTKESTPERHAEGVVDLILFAITASATKNTVFTDLFETTEMATTTEIQVLAEKSA